MRERRNIRTLRRLLDGASGPSFFAGSTLDMRFNLGAYRGANVSNLTVTRASTGFAETEAGVLVSFGSGVPRITDKGLLVEAGRTNLLLRSQEFGTTWATFFSTVSSDASAAPDGTTTADSVIEDSSTQPHGVDQTVAAATNTTYTFSVYAKAGSRSWLRMRIDDGGGSNSNQCWFNLATGVAGTVQNTGTGTGAVARIQAMADGWYRCILTGQPASSSTGSVRCLLRVTTGDTVTAHAGNSTGNLLFWGGQLEAASAATSYIPTTSATAGRASDLINLESTAFSSWYTSTSALSWYVEAEAPLANPGPNTLRLFNVGDGTSSLNRYLVGININQQIRHIVTSGGVNGVDNTDTRTFVTGRDAPVFKVAMALAANDSAIVTGGGNPVVDPSVTIPSPINQLHLGHGGASDQLNGYIRRIAYFPSRLTDAELQTLTSDSPVLDFNFVLGQYTGRTLSQLTVTRASTAYAETAAGVLTSFGSNVPRITDKGLLIEQASTNLMLRSQEFDNASWGKTNMSVVANDIAAPDGTLTADRLTQNNAGTVQYSAAQTVAGYTSGTVYTWSCYFKAGTIDRVQMAISVAAFSGLGYANFYLSGAGSVSQSGGTIVASGIQAMADGWYRCWITLTCTTTASASTLLYPLLTGTETRGPTLVGSQGTFYAWGGQVEATNPFPTSYIPTTTGSVTRAVDNIAFTGINFSSWFTNPNAGTIRCEWTQDGLISGSNPRLFEINDGTANEIINTIYNSPNLISEGLDGGVTQWSISSTAPAVGTNNKLALAYSTSDIARSLNGAAVGTDGSATLPTMNAARLGNRAALDRAFCGYIRRFAYYPYRLPNAKLLELAA